MDRRQNLKVLASLLVTGCTAHRPGRALVGEGGIGTDRLMDFIRLRGDTSGKPVYLWFTGRAYSVVPGAVGKPLVDIQICSIDQYKQISAQEWQVRHQELVQYRDRTTGRLLGSFRNPLTGELVEAIHHRSGPSVFTFSEDSVNGSDPNDLSMPIWNDMGSDIVVTLPLVGSYSDGMSLDEWPKASVGGVRYFADFIGIHARSSDLHNRELSFVPATLTAQLYEPWVPWMEMAGRPGMMLTTATGRKITTPDALPESFRQVAERLHPGVLYEPWEVQEHSSAQTAYKQRSSRP